MEDKDFAFSGSNVPIAEVARVMKKDKQFVRIGIQEKWLPIGVAYKREGSNEYSYYVSPKKLYEYTGYIYEGWQNDNRNYMFLKVILYCSFGKKKQWNYQMDTEVYTD